MLLWWQKGFTNLANNCRHDQ